MTIEDFIQNSLTDIADIRQFVGNRIYGFTSEQGAEKPFIRWDIIEDKPMKTILSGNVNIYTCQAQVSIFANSFRSARTIADSIEAYFKSLSFTNEQIKDVRTEAISPIVEDKTTIHYPIRITLIYRKTL